MFSGIGLAIIGSGVAIPYCVKLSISFAWLMVAVAGVIVTIVGWILLPSAEKVEASGMRADKTNKFRATIPLILLLAAYMFYGIGGVPHSLFIVQYIANRLHFGNYLGGVAWIFYGVGVLVGPLLVGFLADHLDTRVCLISVYFLGIIALGLPLTSQHLAVLYISTLLAGGVSFCIVSLLASRLSEIMHGPNYTAWWGYAAALFAFSQAATAYLMSLLMAVSNGYLWMFAIGGMAFFTAFIFMMINLSIKRPVLRKGM